VSNDGVGVGLSVSPKESRENRESKRSVGCDFGGVRGHLGRRGAVLVFSHHGIFVADESLGVKLE